MAQTDRETQDTDLVRRHLAGDRTAIARLIEIHEGPLLRFARARLGDESLAQDAVQETFLRFLREGARMRDVKALFPWFLQVARRVCLDLQRKEGSMERKHEGARREAAGPAVAAPDEALMSGESNERVREAVARLPEAQREVLRLKLWEGLTYREIGTRLGMTLTNVSYHLGQAVRAVAGQLRSQGIVG
ncbi:MAG: RNA polymerase sigma factor [Planctomycetes bacterium]|nr:RNA polymerase sigma factor [Planctomycetota bacterium]